MNSTPTTDLVEVAGRQANVPPPLCSGVIVCPSSSIRESDLAGNWPVSLVSRSCRVPYMLEISLAFSFTKGRAIEDDESTTHDS